VAVATENEYGLFIDGESTDAAAGEERDVVEPATGGLIGRAAMGSEADVDRALDLYLETKGVLVSTSPKPFNPFGL
jgi:acyl-CoA reductase-like NAD-dependent aldehyde dehydrogenase